MPKFYICKHAGCQNTTLNRGYCDEHAILQVEQDRRRAERAFASAERPNARLYNSQRWKTLSAKLRRQVGLCQRCGSVDELQVHHLTPPRGDEGLFFELANLQVVCGNCHRLITAGEVRARTGTGRGEAKIERRT